jgi:uncharacterized protein (TIGR02266 family)
MDERRHACPRIKINIKTTFKHSGVTVSADILNLSSGGIFIKTDSQPPIDATLSLRFHLPGDPEPLDTEGQVVWIKQESKAAHSGMGVQFNKISPWHKKRIQAFVESFMVD